MAKKIKVKRKESKSIKPIYKIAVVIVLIGIFVLLVFPDLFKKQKEEYYVFKKDGELTFYTESNEPIVTIDIEIADTEYKRQLGLMKRKELGESEGMLFIFPIETRQSFWMRNTLLSLDMIFVNSERKIVTIHKNTTPLSDQSYPSTAPALYVVEVNAGFTSRYNINEGDLINWNRNPALPLP